MNADLVCEGGGVKGVALAGAITYLQEHGYEFKKIAGNSARALKNLMFFKCGYPQSKKIVNEAEVFSFINYFYLVIYIITRIFLS